jgi:hypothetical protein
MRKRARFRRWLGIFGAASVVTLTATGAALTVGQAAAGAASVSAFTVDLGGPNLIFQNMLGNKITAISTTPTQPVNGWSFTVTGWFTGDEIVINAGTPNGQNPVTIENDVSHDPLKGGYDSQCNTPYPKGVNEGHYDGDNWATFSAQNAGGSPTTDAPVLEATGGANAPIIDAQVVNTPDCDTAKLPVIGAVGGQTLILTFENSAFAPTTTATVYLGFASTTPTAATLDPLIMDVGPGTAQGAVNFTGYYLSGGCPTLSKTSGCMTTTPTESSVDNASALTIPSSAVVVGQGMVSNSPASGLVRTTGGDQVAQTAVSDVTFNEIGAFLPPNNQGTGPLHAAVAEALVYPGTICVTLDPADNGWQNLQFGPSFSSSFSYTSGKGSSYFATGDTSVSSINSPHDTLQIQVPHDTNFGFGASLTLSGITLGTIPGSKTYADGPVWIEAWWVNDTSPNACSENVHDDAVVKGNEATAELDYGQISTVSELADSIYGYTAAETSAQVIGHQFDYADGACVGPANDNGAMFVATDADYHDALGAAFPAGAFNTGVVLTDPTTLLSSTASIIREEGVQVVYLVGGNLAVSDAVENALANTVSYHCGGRIVRLNDDGQPQDLTVIRVAGFTADDTNRLLETLPGPEFIAPTPGPFGAFSNPALFNDTGSGQSTAAPTTTVQNTAILVTDSTFQDAITGSGLAYGWPMPLVVTPPTGLSLDALAALTDNHITQVLVLGGVDAISDTVISQLAANGISALRIAGMDGSDTSTQFASFVMAASPSEAGVCWTKKGASCVGLGLDNNDLLWNYFVSRTAGLIGIANSSFGKDQTGAHVVIMTRGDSPFDAMTSAPLAIHDPSDDQDINAFPDYASTNGLLVPTVLTESPTSVGSALTTFFNKAGLAVSGLAGEQPADGWAPSILRGDQENNPSSNVYTIQPVGGTFALTPSTLQAALAAITAG